MHTLLVVVAALVTAQTPSSGKPATAEDAKAFVKKLDADLRKLWVRQSTAEWIKSTYITDDTERNAAAFNEDAMAYLTQANKDALRFKGLKLDPETERMLYLLRISSALPAPSNAEKRTELANTAAKLEGLYGKGKSCKAGGQVTMPPRGSSGINLRAGGDMVTFSFNRPFGPGLAPPPRVATSPCGSEQDRPVQTAQ